MFPRILTIAGSDSIGGAGIQADIKAINHFGAHATCAITAVTAQDLKGVYDVHYIHPDIVQSQIKTVLMNGISHIKIGMLGNLAISTIVFNTLVQYSNLTIVLDPVITSTSGAQLLTQESVEYIKKNLFPIAHLITPNIPEAELILQKKINSPAEMIGAGMDLLEFGSRAVLIKGGHLKSSTKVVDILFLANKEIYFFENDRINISTTHGTGCALSASIATLLGREFSFKEASEKAIAYVRNKIMSDKEIFFIDQY